MLIIFKWHQFDPYNPFCGLNTMSPSIQHKIRTNTQFLLFFCFSFFTCVRFLSAVCKWDRLNGVCMHEIIMCVYSCLLPFNVLYFLPPVSSWFKLLKTHDLKCFHCRHTFFIFFLHNQFQSLVLCTVNQIDIWPCIKECGREKKSTEHQIHHHTVENAYSVFWRITNGRLDKRKLRNHFPKVIIHLCDKFLQSNTRATKRWRWRQKRRPMPHSVLASFIVRKHSNARNWNDCEKHSKAKQKKWRIHTQIIVRKIFIHKYTHRMYTLNNAIYGSICGSYNFQRKAIFRYRQNEFQTFSSQM